VIEIAQSLSASASLRRLNLSRNDLFYGGRRLGLQLGINAAKCSSLTRIDLSQNALTTEMACSLLKGLGDAPRLHRVDLSRNEIGEFAGRAFVAFLQKAVSLRRLDVSYNPMLNITVNREMGQRKLEEDAKKPGAKKDKKPKKYVPACYAIVAALAKTVSVKEVGMLGVVADPWEWEAKLAILEDRVAVPWRAVDVQGFKVRIRPPPTPPAPREAESPRRNPRRKQ
jgi:hypothetical protein